MLPSGIGMEFGISKYATLMTKRGIIKKVRVGIQLSNDEFMTNIEERVRGIQILSQWIQEFGNKGNNEKIIFL